MNEYIDYEDRYGEYPDEDVAPAKKKFKVTLQVTVEVEAKDEDDVYDKLDDVEIEKWEWDVVKVREI